MPRPEPMVCAVSATLPWHELDMESVCVELKKQGGGLSLEGMSSPYDNILHSGLAVSPGSRHLTLDQLRNTLGIALTVATTKVLITIIIYYKIVHEVHDRQTYRENSKNSKSSTKHKHWLKHRV